MASKKLTIRGMVNVSYVDKARPGSEQFISMPNCTGVDRSYNAKFRLDGQLHLWQNDGKAHEVVLNWDPKDFSLESLIQRLHPSGDPGTTPISAQMYLNLTGQPTVIFRLIQGRKPEGIKPRISDFPIFNYVCGIDRLRLHFDDVQKIKNWDFCLIESLLAGRETGTSK